VPVDSQSGELYISVQLYNLDENLSNLLEILLTVNDIDGSNEAKKTIPQDYGGKKNNGK
jgi:hypothetical protein